MNVLICNAYSANNSGDGLLVHLTEELINDSIPGPHNFFLSTADPMSFPGRALTFGPFRGRTRPAKAIAGLLAMLVPIPFVANLMQTRLFAEALREADLIVSVGGGYLRGDSLTALVKSTSVHLTQMVLAGRSNTPWVVAPQSIGPYPSMAWPLVRRVLRRARLVMVRDDVSFRDLTGLATLMRVPDLAILSMTTESSIRPEPAHATVGIVLRRLSRPRCYYQDVDRLLKANFPWLPLLQSTHSGNDDRGMLRDLGLDSPGRLRDALSDEDSCLGAVISVRLHGALESLRGGVPAVHLSYERKGIAAFSDLGLDKYVHSARGFDVQLVMEQIAELLRDPSLYWASIQSRIAEIQATRRMTLCSISMAAGLQHAD